MHGVELLLEQRSICVSSIELVDLIALLLRNDLSVNPWRAPSAKVLFASANSGLGGAMLSTTWVTILPSFLSSFSGCNVVWRMLESNDRSRAPSNPGMSNGASSV